MNDFMEMHWGYRQWELAADRLLKHIDREFIDLIDKILSFSSTQFMPLASCLSLSPDVLSQWRAYAEDGNGFCIGFRDNALCNLAARPLTVLYDDEKQQQEIMITVKALHTVHTEEKDEDALVDFCASLAADLSAMKNPSFLEEQEIRLIHLINFVPSNDFLKLEDAGGTAFGEAREPTDIAFQMKGSVPSPYIDMSISNAEGNHCIEEVILGPKNNALTTGVSVFLETLGLGNVNVRKSAASYR